MRHPQHWSKTLLLSLALAAIAIPAWAQQGGMAGMGDRSIKPPRSTNPSGMGTMAPGNRPGAGSMGGTDGISNMPATRPLGVAGLGVRSGMSGMAGMSGSQGAASGMGGMPGGSSLSGSGMSGRAGMTGGSAGMSSTGSMAGAGTRSSAGGMSGGASPFGMGGASSLGSRPRVGGQSGLSRVGGRLGVPSGPPAAPSTSGMSGMPER